MFYHLGDDYELFFKGAEMAAKLLGITLTRRGSASGEPIKMAGVPYHAAEHKQEHKQWHVYSLRFRFLHDTIVRYVELESFFVVKYPG